jgi:hypothetical protein
MIVVGDTQMRSQTIKDTLTSAINNKGLHAY